MAEENGYVVERPCEAWDWPKEQRSVSTLCLDCLPLLNSHLQVRLWRPFMRRFFEAKAKASPVPSDPRELDQLIEELRETVKIHLTPESFQPNPTLRALSKFALKYVA